jgi:hypothetical protein
MYKVKLHEPNNIEYRYMIPSIFEVCSIVYVKNLWRVHRQPPHSAFFSWTWWEEVTKHHIDFRNMSKLIVYEYLSKQVLKKSLSDGMLFVS